MCALGNWNKNMMHRFKRESIVRDLFNSGITIIKDFGLESNFYILCICRIHKIFYLIWFYHSLRPVVMKLKGNNPNCFIILYEELKCTYEKKRAVISLNFLLSLKLPQTHYIKSTKEQRKKRVIYRILRMTNIQLLMGSWQMRLTMNLN